MGTTTDLALRYPELTDAANGPAGFQNLASDVESYLPRGVRAARIASVTSTQGSITTEADATNLTLTWTPSGSRRYRLDLILKLSSTVASDHGGAYITDSGNTHLAEAEMYLPVTTGRKVTLTCFCFVTPTAGVSVTYKARVARVAGSGTLTLEAASTYPAILVATDVGPAS